MPIQFAIVGQFGGQQPPFKFSDGRDNSHQLDIEYSDMDLKFSSQFRSFQCSGTMARADVLLEREDAASSNDSVL